MRETEVLDRTRRRMLLGGLVGFGIWQGLSIADRLLGRMSLSRGVHTVLLTLSLAAWAYWSFHLIQMVRWSRRVTRDPGLAASLNDERIQQARMKAFTVAFFAVLAVQTIPLFTAISAAVAGQLTILVGCTAAIGSYLVFERA